MVYSQTGGNLVDPQAGEYELSHPSHMMTTETTQAAFEKVMGYNISYYSHPEKPVDFISHLEAFVFANLISEHVGLPEEEWCYTCTMTEGQEPCIPDEEYIFENIYECTGFRLGTEWEFEICNTFRNDSDYWTEWDTDGNAIGGYIAEEDQKPEYCISVTDTQILDGINTLLT